MNLWEAMGAVRAGKNVRFHVVTPGGVLALTSQDLERTEFHLVDETATSPSDLPFAAAMALDPSEVEYTAYGLRWDSLATFDNHRWTWDELKLLRFRLRRPRRSRVQEMAVPKVKGLSSDIAIELGLERERFGTEAIRAVCEYLKTRWRLADVVVQVAREFLEPR